MARTRKSVDKDVYLVMFVTVFTGSNQAKSSMLKVEAINKHDAAKQVTALREHPMLLGLKVIGVKCIRGSQVLLKRAEREKVLTVGEFEAKLDEAHAVVQARLAVMDEPEPMEEAE